MKVALVHDYIKEYGGAERVLEALHEIYPSAPVYTTVYLPEFLGPHRQRFDDWKIITSGFQKIPFIHKLISPLRVITPWYFDNIDFSAFDLVIVSATGAYFPNLIVRRPDTLHVCYCHTPPRYLYGYPTARNWQKSIFGKIAAGFFNHTLRQVDFVAAQRPDYFIANSNETRKRIEKFYRREATVIYPPVNMNPKSLPRRQAGEIRNPKLRNEGKYYLTGGRLARAKRIDLAIEACNKLRVPLKAFGKSFADYGDELKNMAGPTIEFLGEVTEDELVKLYQNCKAFIYPAQQEDFGIMPVEAMAAGIPVIALNQGGVKESVVEGKTGVFFDEPTVESLIKAIKQLSNLAIKGEDCIKNAQRFSKERFKREIENFVAAKFKEQRTNNR